MGEITAEADVDYENTARRVIRDIGYTRPEYGFDDSVRVEVSIHEQSPDIARWEWILLPATELHAVQAIRG